MDLHPVLTSVDTLVGGLARMGGMPSNVPFELVGNWPPLYLVCGCLTRGTAIGRLLFICVCLLAERQLPHAQTIPNGNEAS